MSDSGDRSFEEMHHEVAWMKPSDRRIVREIYEYGGWMKPATLALNLPFTRNHIAGRCRDLTAGGILERHEGAAGYCVTELGKQFLNDELQPSDLPDSVD